MVGMDETFLKRGYYFTPQLLEAWAEFHAPSKDYSPSAAGAFLIWMALEPDIREMARRAALSDNIKRAIVKVKKRLSDSLVDAEIKAELDKLEPPGKAKFLAGARQTHRKSRNK